VGNNPITQIFQHHGNQCLKFHFLPFLNAEDQRQMRGTCKIIKQNIPQPQYSYFKTKSSNAGRARIETNTGSVETRGSPIHGGDSSSVISYLQSDVKTVFSTGGSFAALKTNGRVITWGHPQCGGDSSSVIPELRADVKTVFSTSFAFAALKTNGRVITWGHSNSGGDSSNVSEFLQNGVIQIEAIPNQIFCATKSDGTQVQWP